MYERLPQRLEPLVTVKATLTPLAEVYIEGSKILRCIKKEGHHFIHFQILNRFEFKDFKEAIILTPINIFPQQKNFKAIHWHCWVISDRPLMGKNNSV